MSELSVKDQLKARMRELKDKKMLPNGYGKTVVQMVLDRAKKEGRDIKCTVNNVSQVVMGNSIRADIVEALLELAENNKEKRLLDRANKLFDDEST